MNTFYIVLTIVLGYFVGMIAEHKAPNLNKKIAFFSTIGSLSFAYLGYNRLAQFLAGLAVYDLGSQAGFTFVPSDKDGLGAIKKDKRSRQTKVKYKGEIFKVIYSDWFYPYELNSKEVAKKTTIQDYLSKHYMDEIGLYEIRNSDTKESLYIGICFSNIRGYERIYRHFQYDKIGVLSHGTYDRGINGDNYQVRLIQINNPTAKRLKLFEMYLHNRINPLHSKVENKKALKYTYQSQSKNIVNQNVKDDFSYNEYTDPEDYEEPF